MQNTKSPIKLNNGLRKVPKQNGKATSIILKSLVTRFKILPVGTLSKNSFKGAYKRLFIIEKCNLLETVRLDKPNIIALNKAKKPKERAKIK